VTSYHEYTDNDKLNALVDQLMVKDIALISDAGTPGISDPGYRLVKEAIARGIKIVPLPGANAVLSALITSGMPTDKFLFLGFLPRQQTARTAALQEVLMLPYTLVLYESPHRLRKLLTDLDGMMGNRTICIGRELTKMYEEFWRGTPSEGLAHFADGTIKGEVTVVIEGYSIEPTEWTEELLRTELGRLIESGLSKKDASAQLAKECGWRPKQLYKMTLSL